MPVRVAPLLFVFVVCTALLSYDGVDRQLRAIALLMRWTHAPGSEAMRDRGVHPVISEPLTLSFDDRTLEAIEYRPSDLRRAPPVVLVHGAHYRGMREQRLMEFAAALASAGLTVITPQLDELTRHNIAPSTIRTLQRVTRAAARRARYETAGLVGISFAGSLALLAAARETEPRAISAVTAIGAYASLERLGRWYAGDVATDPDGHELTIHPHPYGSRVLFQAHADTVFGTHAAAVRRILSVYLRDDLHRAHDMAMELPEPPRREVLELVSTEDHPLADKLRALLVEHRRELAAVSPEGQLAQLRVPALLCHGTDDPVIPSSETAWLAREVPRFALRASLITAAIRHAEMQERPSLAELWALVQFTTALLEVSELQEHSPMP